MNNSLRNSGIRPQGTKDDRKMFVIITEGQSEYLYFKHFLSSTGPRLYPCNGKGISKFQLVKKAIEERQKLIENNTYQSTDETWVVLDRDIDRNKKNDKETFNRALLLAKTNSINIACSNDSFELWIILHFKDFTSGLTRKELDSAVKKYLKGYQHGDDVYDKINAGYEDAVKRAKRQHKHMQKMGKKLIDMNPSTNIYILTEKLKNNMSS